VLKHRGLQRGFGVLVLLETLYVLGLTVLFSQMSASFYEFDRGELGAGSGVGLVVGVAGAAIVGLLAFTAVGLWAGWVNNAGRRGTAARTACALTVSLHGAIAIGAALGSPWGAIGGVIIAVLCLALVVRSQRQPHARA
jgi:hypothetical protein